VGENYGSLQARGFSQAARHLEVALLAKSAEILMTTRDTPAERLSLQHGNCVAIAMMSADRGRAEIVFQGREGSFCA
jgi:hypothetical protein